MMNIKNCIILALGLVLSVSFSNKTMAQYDPLFTQYMFNELFINPAYSGSHDALSLNALHRQQWVGIQGRPVTTTFTAHAPIAGKSMGLGLGLMQETIGVTKKFNILANYAYRIKLGAGSNLAFGLQAGVINLADQVGKVSTGNTNDQLFSGTQVSGIVPNFGFGTYYYTDKFYVGLSVPRMLENKVAVGSTKFDNKFNFKNFHYYLTGGYVFTVNPSLKLKPSAMIKLVDGAPVEFDATLNGLIKDVIWLGAAYRSNDAISALLGYQFTPQLRVGYSYDYTLTELQKYNSGSHEVNVSYIFKYKSQKVVSPRLF